MLKEKKDVSEYKKAMEEKEQMLAFYKQIDTDNKNLEKRVQNLKLQIEFYMYSEQLESVVAEMEKKKELIQKVMAEEVPVFEESPGEPYLKEVTDEVN